MTRYLLGIDIGTGSTKAVALGTDDKPLAVFQEHYKTCSPLPGYSEQDPDEILRAFCSCIRKAMAHFEGAPFCIGLSSAMHSLLAVDANGLPLCPAMTWADTRAAEIARTLLESGMGKSLYHATGTPIHAMSPLCKLMWLHRHATGLFNDASKFISVKEYVWYKLFGEYRVDYSIASSTGLFNIHDLRWDTGALEMAKLSEDRLSIPVDTGYLKRGRLLLPELSSLPLDVPFVIGASDGCTANLGSQVMQPGTAAITIGTSGAVRATSPRPLATEAMTFCYLLDARTYVCGGPVNNGGIAVQWLLRNVFGKTGLTATDYKWLFNLAEAIPPGSDGLIFLPYLNGERAPLWNAEATGAFIGLKQRHTQGHLARAVLEGICYALRDVLLSLEAEAGYFHHIHVSGGFVHSLLWLQLLADITGKELVLFNTEDASAIGAAYIALKALGYSSDYPQPAIMGNRIVPDKDRHAAYRTCFSGYRRLSESQRY
ncbi:gluconokinase [Pedobacter sp. JY14-1]|uniref:gluconokinase n=1 Tax=Pedobacter sp. JY14-1 TaxID=3034151 RepID=UPI0023E215DF|nr:gluconokinase [Pedobacter sp. JY14-1]